MEEDPPQSPQSAHLPYTVHLPVEIPHYELPSNDSLHIHMVNQLTRQTKIQNLQQKQTWKQSNMNLNAVGNIIIREAIPAQAQSVNDVGIQEGHLEERALNVEVQEEEVEVVRMKTTCIILPLFVVHKRLPTLHILVMNQI